MLMFQRIGLEFQCYKGWGLNSSVRKDRAEIPMLKRIRPGKDRAEIPMLKRTGPEFQC